MVGGLPIPSLPVSGTWMDSRESPNGKRDSIAGYNFTLCLFYSCYGFLLFLCHDSQITLSTEFRFRFRSPRLGWQGALEEG